LVLRHGDLQGLLWVKTSRRGLPSRYGLKGCTSLLATLFVFFAASARAGVVSTDFIACHIFV
jgi:hypothetical protein